MDTDRLARAGKALPGLWFIGLMLLAGRPCQGQAPAGRAEQLGEFLFGLSQVRPGVVALSSELGVRWMRPVVSWRDVEPDLNEPSLTVDQVKSSPLLIELYSRRVDWSVPDGLLSSMTTAGIQAFAVVGHGYTYRLPRYHGQPATPDVIGRELYLGHLYLHVRAVVERYDGDGYLDAPGIAPIHYWQIENELNEAFLTALWGWRAPSFEAAYGSAWQDWSFLTRLVEVLSDAVKSSDPKALVAVNFHTDVSEALSAVLSVKSWREAIVAWRDKLDIIGVDAYPDYYRAAPVLGQVVGDRVAEVRQLSGGKPVIVLETGYPSGPFVAGFSESLQDAYIQAAYTSAVLAGAEGYFHFGSVTSESHSVSISPEDLANLDRVAAAYAGDDAGWLLVFALTRMDYIKSHFIYVLQAVEGYWGLVRSDGSRKPSWYTIRELALRNR